MNKLFFDIETIPCHEDDKERFLQLLKEKKEKARKKAKKEEAEEIDEEELWSNMGLDGTFGRIFCIAYIKDDGVTQEKEIISGDEKEILIKFWEVTKDVNLFVGHNVMSFDLPFIYQRSIINFVKPSMNITLARYRSNPVFDTMYEWVKWDMRKHVSLDTLARVFGYPTSKDNMNGSMVWQAYQDGKFDEICEYCMKDVELNRKVYYRMILEKLPEEPTESSDPF